MTKSLSRYGKFLTISSLSKLPAFFCLSSPSGIPKIHRLVLLLGSHSSCRLSSLFFVLFSLFSSEWITSNVLSSNSQILFFCLIHSVVDTLFAFFISFTVSFSTGIFVWSLLMISIALSNFSFVCYFLNFIELSFCIVVLLFIELP